MSVALHLGSFALDQLLEGACRAIGFAGGEKATSAVTSFLKQHLTDHSAKLDKALRTANDRAWRAFELALGGESFLSKCAAFFAQADQKAFAHQVRRFLEDCPLTAGSNDAAEVRRECLRELQAARKAGLLDLATHSPDGILSGAVSFARFSDPQRRAQEGTQTVAQMAAELKACGYETLARLVASQAPPESSLLVTAVRFFFRLELQADEQLWRGLAWASWQQTSQAQERGFACLGAALAQNARRLEEMLAATHQATLDILAEVRGQREQIVTLANRVQDLLVEHRLADRELRPNDSLSIRSPVEREQVARMLAWYRALPPEQQAALPAVLNGLGKLQHACGDLKGAQATFEALASAPLEPRAKAEIKHNAHLSALERHDWPAALAELLAATDLDAARFRPFDLGVYEPLRILGAGGFGVAYLCRHRLSGGLRVIKTIRTDDLSPRTAQRIVQEARVMENVRHEAVVTLYDCAYADAGRTRPYLTMEHFDGVTLADYVAQEGPLGQREAIDLARQIAEGLAAAHQRGVLHRDVKPGNVLVRKTSDGWKVKIIDFGLALQSAEQEAAASRATTLHEVAGTLDYAAPEQIGRLPGVAVDGRADVYGFGRTCCFALFGTPNPIGRQWRELPKGFAAWLDSCVEESPQRRPANFADVLAALARVRPGRSPKEKDEPARLPALVVSRGRSVNAEYVLQEGKNVLGREGADVDLEEQEDPERCFISREHCAVTLAKGELSGEDLGSANGTFVNRQRLAPGERRPLNAGDVIQLGAVVLTVRE